MIFETDLPFKRTPPLRIESHEKYVSEIRLTAHTGILCWILMIKNI